VRATVIVAEGWQWTQGAWWLSSASSLPPFAVRAGREVGWLKEWDNNVPGGQKRGCRGSSALVLPGLGEVVSFRGRTNRSALTGAECALHQRLTRLRN